MQRPDDRPHVRARPERGRTRYELVEPYRDDRGRRRVRYHRLGSSPDPIAALARLRQGLYERLACQGPAPDPAELAVTRDARERINALAAAIGKVGTPDPDPGVAGPGRQERGDRAIREAGFEGVVCDGRVYLVGPDDSLDGDPFQDAVAEPSRPLSSLLDLDGPKGGSR